MKRILLLLPLLLLPCCQAPQAPKGMPPVFVTATKVQRADIPIVRDYIGYGDAYFSVKIYPQVSGKILTTHFNPGQLVHAGDTLATLDSSPYVANLQKAQSQLEKNKATLQMAKEKAETYTELIKDDIISQLEFDQALTDVLTLDAEIESNNADNDLAQLDIRWCTIHSPITGIPSIEGLGQGTYVTAGSSSPIVIIKQIVPILLNISIPEEHFVKIRSLKKEGPVRVQAFSIEDHPSVYEGTLDFVDNSMDKGTGSIVMQATFPNPEAKMWPNEYFKTRLHLGVIQNALVVPEEAVIKTQKGEAVFVVKEDNTVEERYVKTSENFEGSVVITEGVSDLESVVTAGQINLSEGSKVVIKE